MKKLRTLIIIIFVSLNIHAQKSEDSKNSEVPDSNTDSKIYLNSAKHSEKSKLGSVPLIVQDSPIIIDGNLNETEWPNAVTFKDFLQTDPEIILPLQNRPKHI